VPRLLLLSFIWGWSFLFIKVAGEDLTPTAVAGGRCVLGALVLLAVVRLQGLSLPRGRTLGHFLVVGVAGSAVPFALLAWGEQHIDSGLTAVLNASTPLFTAALAVPLLGERARPRVVAGLVVGFVGVGIVSGIGGSDLTGTDVLAALAPVAAGACYGFTFCWAARHLLGIPPLVAATGQVTAAAIVLAPFAAVTSVAHGVVPDWQAIGSLLLLGALGTGLAYVLSFRVIAELGPTVASLCTYIIPVVALAVGWAVLDETITLRIVVGGVVIVASILVVTRDRSRGQRAAAVEGPGTEVGAPPPEVAPGPPTSTTGRRRAALLGGVGLVAAVTAAGCGGGGDATCEPVRREPFDSRAVHVLPGSDAPEYQTDPPTSGPHLPAPPGDPVRTEPIDPAVQVGLLEEGRVLIQHHGLDDAERTRVEALAGDDVVVAPAESLPEDAAVVATAWVTKQVCRGVDVEALRTFADEHGGGGPGGHG
jgi:drug/metabolite transporter (DMT)-like permease